MTDVCSYADNTTFHTCDFDLKTHMTRLWHDVARFESSYMKLNHDKCYFQFLGHKYETLFANVGEVKI